MFKLFFFKQKTAYEMRISDWSSDVCSSDLAKGKPLGYDFITFYSAAEVARDHGAPAAYDLGAMRAAQLAIAPGTEQRSEARRVGKAWVSTCKSRWSPYT